MKEIGGTDNGGELWEPEVSKDTVNRMVIKIYTQILR
jgi:hypothetical protein